MMQYKDIGTGPLLLFIHGFPFSGSAWAKQTETLKQSYRLIVPDLDSASTLDQYADSLQALIKKLGCLDVTLIGHSMGGYIALNFALRYPSLLKGLVLVATKSAADTVEAASGRKTLAEKVKKEGAQVVVNAMSVKMLADINSNDKNLLAVRKLMDMPAPQIISALLAMADRNDTTDKLKNISVPTLVITGDKDVLIPSTESEKMARLLPNATLKVIPNTGHLLFYENTEGFNKVLTEWLAQHN